MAEDKVTELKEINEEVSIESAMESILMILYKLELPVFGLVGILEMLKLQIIEDAREEE